MVSRTPHLRNRKRIKAPRRYEDELVTTNTSSPCQESDEETDASSELQEERYSSPKPRSRSRLAAYRGPVIEFNPNLPPAAFPTIDCPSQASSAEHLNTYLKSLPRRISSKALSEQDAALAPAKPRKDPTSSGRYHASKLSVSDPNMTLASARHLSRAPQPRIRPSITVHENGPDPRPSIYGGPRDNGPLNPLCASNMDRLEELNHMKQDDRFILDCMTSEDEDDARGRSTKVTQTASNVPTWDDLSIAHKLDLADTVAEIYSDATHVMQQLQLNPLQKKELTDLLIQRQDRLAREKANREKLQEETEKALLSRKGRLSQTTYHNMVEQILYATIAEGDDHLQTTLSELRNARAYLQSCGFDPNLLNDTWGTPSISDVPATERSKAATNRSEGRPTISVPQASTDLPNQNTSSHATQATYTPHVSDPLRRNPGHPQCLDHGTTLMRPITPSKSQATRSPPASLSKVPSQMYRVAPSGISRVPVTALPTGSKAFATQRSKLGSNSVRQGRNASTLPTPPEEPTLPILPVGSCTPAMAKQAISAQHPQKTS